MLREKAIIVAECGYNHGGDIDTALAMVKSASGSGAGVVKFRKRCPHPFLSPQEHALWERLELTINQHVALAKACEENGVIYSTSVWDLASAKEVVKGLDPAMIKVPSQCNHDLDLIRYLDTKYDGEVHISLGMMVRDDSDVLWEFIRATKHPERYTLYACTSGFPVSVNKAYLMEIPFIVKRFGSLGCRVGYSGHHRGVALDLVAYSLGADIIERHFTLSHRGAYKECVDSLNSSELADLHIGLVDVHAAMKEKPAKLDKVEVEERNKLVHRSR